jgi:hypothetical protein
MLLMVCVFASGWCGLSCIGNDQQGGPLDCVISFLQDEVYCWGEADLPAAAGPANPAAASGNSEGGVSSEGGTSEPWRLGRQTSSVGNRQMPCTMLLWPLHS